MNTNRSRSPLARVAVFSALALCAGLVAPVLADGPAPDPPVPVEGASRAQAADVDREPDCRCSALRVRDLAGRIEGHVEQWQALTQAPGAEPRKSRPHALHGKAFVEGVVGFPMRQFRLASDTDEGMVTR